MDGTKVSPVPDLLNSIGICMHPLGTSVLRKRTATDELLEQLDHFRAGGEFAAAKMVGD